MTIPESMQGLQCVVLPDLIDFPDSASVDVLLYC